MGRTKAVVPADRERKWVGSEYACATTEELNTRNGGGNPDRMYEAAREAEGKERAPFSPAYLYI